MAEEPDRIGVDLAQRSATSAGRGQRAAAEARTDGGRQGRPRHYRRAQRDRGGETRLRLLDAALDIFGLQGFEGATTRQIAKAAGANLAAIVYHFGSKEALYRAVAEHVANHMMAAAGPAIAVAADPAASQSRQAARAMYHRLIETYVEILIGTQDAERWARFIVREQMHPTAAFDVIYGIMGGALAVGTRLVASALGRAEDDELRLRMFSLFGQVLVFRVAQALVLKRMGWTSIGPAERAEIKRVVLSQVDAIFDREAAP